MLPVFVDCPFLIVLSIFFTVYFLLTEQSSKGKGKNHKSTNRTNHLTIGKQGRPQWP
jgi:hypothetical protein